MPVEVRPEMTIVYPKEWCLDEVIWERKRICVDLDGVICEYDFPKIVKDFFGIELSALDIFAYDLADVLGVSPLLINSMFQQQVYGKPNFIEGAIETLKKWELKGYEIQIYSNRLKYMGYEGLLDWLQDFKIPFTSIGVGGSEYDFHIDDSPSKLMSTQSKVKLLYSQPWNKRCLNIKGELTRVYNWKEVEHYVQTPLDTVTR